MYPENFDGPGQFVVFRGEKNHRNSQALSYQSAD